MARLSQGVTLLAFLVVGPFRKSQSHSPWLPASGAPLTSGRPPTCQPGSEKQLAQNTPDGSTNHFCSALSDSCVPLDSDLAAATLLPGEASEALLVCKALTAALKNTLGQHLASLCCPNQARPRWGWPPSPASSRGCGLPGGAAPVPPLSSALVSTGLC